MPALEVLNRQGETFTDASLVHLAGARRLKRLFLRSDRMEITDSGPDHLAGLKVLRQLSPQGARLTVEGKAKLINAIPGLRISP